MAFSVETAKRGALAFSSFFARPSFSSLLFDSPSAVALFGSSLLTESLALPSWDETPKSGLCPGRLIEVETAEGFIDAADNNVGSVLLLAGASFSLVSSVLGALPKVKLNFGIGSAEKTGLVWSVEDALEVDAVGNTLDAKLKDGIANTAFGAPSELEAPLEPVPLVGACTGVTVGSDAPTRFAFAIGRLFSIREDSVFSA